MSALDTDQWRGAVSLTFDDGTDNQLQYAFPPLTERGLCGTIYLHARDRAVADRKREWMAVADAGHEIGNHSLAHICANNFSDRRGGLEDVTLAEIEADMLAAQKRLEGIAPHQEHWTFAYPCAGTHVGEGGNRQSYVPLVDKHFLAGRGWGEYGFGNTPQYTDLANVWGIRTDRMGGFEMIGLVEELTARDKWVVLIFHDISGDRITVARDDYLMLCDYLARKKEEIYVAPMAEVAQRVSAIKKA